MGEYWDIYAVLNYFLNERKSIMAAISWCLVALSPDVSSALHKIRYVAPCKNFVRFVDPPLFYGSSVKEVVNQFVILNYLINFVYPVWSMRQIFILIRYALWYRDRETPCIPPPPPPPVYKRINFLAVIFTRA